MTDASETGTVFLVPVLAPISGKCAMVITVLLALIPSMTITVALTLVVVRNNLIGIADAMLGYENRYDAWV